MSNAIRIKLGLLSLSAALILTSNAIDYEPGHWNWGGALSYLGGLAAGIAILSHRAPQSRAAGQAVPDPR